MSDPFLIEGPAVIAFSGGRTSGMMLYKIIEAHGGKLPDDVIPVFCNTGKEHNKTLDFVRDCGVNWNVPIRWIEYQTAEVTANRWREVDYATASRNGEPFEAVIRARRYLPNPVARICTIEMKIAAKQRFVDAAFGWTDYREAIGLRADEPWRVAKSKTREETNRSLEYPLYEAGLTVLDVTAFWAAQPFDLGVNGMSNCDLCYLKGAGTISSIIAKEPSRAIWWAAQEKFMGSQFRSDRPSYAAMLSQGNLALNDESPDNIDCACTE